MNTLGVQGGGTPDFFDLVEAAAGAMRALGYPMMSRQRDYMRAVAETIARGRARSRSAQGAERTAVRAIEASTGTGKSLGYLVPLFIHCAIYGERAGIAVGTIHLQNQLYGTAALAGHRQPSWDAGDRSDMAIATQVLKTLLPDAKTPHIVVRRGMRNYVNPRRVQELVEDAGKKILDDPTWSDFYDWAMRVGSFDPIQQQLDLDGGLSSLGFGLLINTTLPKGITINDVCLRSARESDSNPIYQLINAQSKKSDIVIQTHVSCLLDAMHNHTIFNWIDEESGKVADGERPLSVLVMDEADQAELAGELVSRHKLPVYRIATRTGKWLETSMPEALAGGVQALHDSAVAALEWFDAIHKKSLPDRGSEGFLVIERRRNDLRDAEQHILSLQTGLTLIATAIKDRKGAATLDASARSDLEDWSRGVERIARHAQTVSAREEHPGARSDKVLSLCWSPKQHMPSFQLSEPFPARRFALHFSHKTDGSRDGFLDSAIFTSATLATPSARPFADFYRSVGLIAENEDSVGRYAHDVLPEVQLEPDRFGVLENVYLAHPFAPRPTLSDPDDDSDDYSDLPNYTNPAWVEYVSFILEQLITEHTNEPALALTTSFRNASLIAAALRERNPEAAQRLFLHDGGMHDGLAAGIRSLRSGAASVLLTPSAWQGQDIRREDKSQMLRHVVITSLPFAPPDSLKEHLQMTVLGRYSSLNQDRIRGLLRAQAMRRAWARLRQGIGRLHRHRDDRGSIWILDKRTGLPENLLLSPTLALSGKRTAEEEDDLRRQVQFRSMGMLKAFPARFSRAVSAASVVAPEYGKANNLAGVRIIAPPKPFVL